MTATEITIANASNKTRKDWIYAEQNLKLAIMERVGVTISHIIASPPLAF